MASSSFTINHLTINYENADSNSRYTYHFLHLLLRLPEMSFHAYMSRCQRSLRTILCFADFFFIPVAATMKSFHAYTRSHVIYICQRSSLCPDTNTFSGMFFNMHQSALPNNFFTCSETWKGYPRNSAHRGSKSRSVRTYEKKSCTQLR